MFVLIMSLLYNTWLDVRGTFVRLSSPLLTYRIILFPSSHTSFHTRLREEGMASTRMTFITHLLSL